jgi:hypothetical protein
MFEARKAVKDRIRAEGRKLADLLPREITAQAIELVRADPEYLARAKTAGVSSGRANPTA